MWIGLPHYSLEEVKGASTFCVSPKQYALCSAHAHADKARLGCPCISNVSHRDSPRNAGCYRVLFIIRYTEIATATCSHKVFAALSKGRFLAGKDLGGALAWLAIAMACPHYSRNLTGHHSLSNYL
jgi:hypothetical protein